MWEKLYALNLKDLPKANGEVMLEFPYPSEVWEPEGLAFSEGYLWFASQ